MPRVVDDSSGMETWKNATRSTVVLRRFDRTGKLTDEVVRGGSVFHITPDERRLNQEIAASDDLDMFQNGLLAPVKLIESAEDVEQFKSNPNHMSEDDMLALLQSRSAKAFQERVSNITNPVTLKRLLEMAAQSDEANATVKQVEFVTARLQEVSPSLYTEVQTMLAPGVTALRPKG